MTFLLLNAVIIMLKATYLPPIVTDQAPVNSTDTSWDCRSLSHLFSTVAPTDKARPRLPCLPRGSVLQLSRPAPVTVKWQITSSTTITNDVTVRRTPEVVDYCCARDRNCAELINSNVLRSRRRLKINDHFVSNEK